MNVLKKHIEALIARAAESGQTAAVAMQYAQAAANAANAVATMDTAGMFRTPELITVGALETLLDEARKSPTGTAHLPTRFDARVGDRPKFVPAADPRNSQEKPDEN